MRGPHEGMVDAARPRLVAAKAAVVGGASGCIGAALMGGLQPLLPMGAAFVACVAAEAVLVQAAPKHGWLALPNRRSSHVRPIPTLGGLGFALPIVASLGYAALGGAALGGLALAVAGVGVMGLVDDLHELGRAPRLAGQFAFGCAALWLMPPDWPLWLLGAALVLLVWHVNLYNFMDGIDGLAGGACLFFCLAVQLLAGGAPGWVGDLLWTTVGAMLGFMAFNWPPARIIMGDVGSTLLGFLLAVCVIQLVAQEILPLASCLILLTGFWFDASYTLCVRMVTGQAFWEAHRTHLYQKVAQRKGHLWTTSAFLAFCALWLLPLAQLAQALPAFGALCQLAAALPLAAAAFRLRAGLPEAEAAVDR